MMMGTNIHNEDRKQGSLPTPFSIPQEKIFCISVPMPSSKRLGVRYPHLVKEFSMKNNSMYCGFH